MTPHELLRSVGAFGVPHSGRSLADHLIGTHDLLEKRGCAAEVCRAGLMHSVYGTNAFRHRCVDPGERTRVRALIGERAEHLAWLFCILNRPQTLEAALAMPPAESATLKANDGQDVAVDRRTLTDLCAIEAANLAEQKALGHFRHLRDFWQSESGR